MRDPAKTVINVNMNEWPPVRVLLIEANEPWTLSLFFAHMGEAPAFLGFEVLLETDEGLKNIIDTEGAAGIDVRAFPSLFRRLPMYVEYARAEIAHDRGARSEYLDALRDAGKTRRGLPDRFYREIGVKYEELVAAGEPHPTKAIADRHAPIHKSRASRWVKEARARGYISEAEKGADQ